MKKIVTFLLAGFLVVSAICLDVSAAKKSSKISKEAVQQMSDDIDNLTNQKEGTQTLSDVQLVAYDNTGNIGIIKDVRLPRILCAVLIGASLGVAGTLLQAVMKNPLPDPGITGISSGASLVAIIIMVFLLLK